ncbi:MAG: DUF3224 domain-containing protein [Chloroflexi bacterium]|nr:DUF3224 domain-containing protein [Chloroflexota bacterium]
MSRATGKFDVQLAPQPPYNAAEDSLLGRMSLDKRFHGDLDATSKGEMLTAGTSVDGSAGYVAIERVTGTLQGKQGGFTLLHSGTLMRGAPWLAVAVVPDSGTGELAGLSGTMSIEIVGGAHVYSFDYTLIDP